MTHDRRLVAEALALAEVLESRGAVDPLRLWRPTPKQEAFLDAVLVGDVGENWLIAANRSGKSQAGSYCGATLARFGNQNARYVRAKGSSIAVRDRSTSGWVSALDFNTSRDVIQPKYFDNGFVPPGAFPPFIPEHEIAEWRQNDQVLKLKNGSIIGFKSQDSGRGKYQGAEKDWIHFDEEHSKEVYQEATMRVGARQLRIFGTVTLLPPEGVVGGISWMYPEMIDPWTRGDLPGVGLYSASIYDNPHIMKEEIAKLEARYPPGSVERRIRLEGEWLPGLAGARAYVGFNRLMHVKPLGEPDPYRPIAWCMDFNVEPMVSTVGQRGRDGVFRFYRELVQEQGDVMGMVQMFYEALPRHGAEVCIYGDSTSKNRSRQTGQSDYQLIMNGMRQYGSPIRLKVPERNPPVPDRINAVNRAFRDEQGQVRVEVDPSCLELIADFEQVLRDPRGGIRKITNARDAYYRRTHASDGAGYWIAYEEPVRSRMIGEKRTITIPSPSYALQHVMERAKTGRLLGRR